MRQRIDLGNRNSKSRMLSRLSGSDNTDSILIFSAPRKSERKKERMRMRVSRRNFDGLVERFFFILNQLCLKVFSLIPRF